MIGPVLFYSPGYLKAVRSPGKSWVDDNLCLGADEIVAEFLKPVGCFSVKYPWVCIYSVIRELLDSALL
jgi:hypothetical protein